MPDPRRALIPDDLRRLRTEKSRRRSGAIPKTALQPCDHRETRVLKTSCCTKAKLFCRRAETYVTAQACHACETDPTWLQSRLAQSM